MSRCVRCGVSLWKGFEGLSKQYLCYLELILQCELDCLALPQRKVMQCQDLPVLELHLKLRPLSTPDTRENNTNSILSTGIVRKPVGLNPAQTDLSWCSPVVFWIRSGCPKGLLKPKNVLSFLMKSASSIKGN